MHVVCIKVNEDICHGPLRVPVESLLDEARIAIGYHRIALSNLSFVEVCNNNDSSLFVKIKHVAFFTRVQTCELRRRLG